MKSPAMALSDQLLSDAAEVAGLLWEALRLPARLPFPFTTLWDLCTEHGCEPLVTEALPRQAGGFYRQERWADDMSDGGGGCILLSAHLTLSESCAVMAHELAHRILYTHRLSDWLDGKAEREQWQRRYDEAEWQEAVARAVERKLLHAGGPGFRTDRL